MDDDKYDPVDNLTETDLKEKARRLLVLEPRFAQLLSILSEQIPLPTLLRAAQIAPAMDRWNIPQHAWKILEILEETKEETAQNKLSDLKRVPTSTTQRSSRSGGMDPVTAFVFGAVFF